MKLRTGMRPQNLKNTLVYACAHFGRHIADPSPFLLSITRLTASAICSGIKAFALCSAIPISSAVSGVTVSLNPVHSIFGRSLRVESISRDISTLGVRKRSAGPPKNNIGVRARRKKETEGELCLENGQAREKCDIHAEHVQI
ncbi:MAG: hypothetical protein GF410_12170 [Chitinivibrionales bacterium]|nr:hypothetical protein [Chitinivibrionales bacterium]